MTTYWTPFLHLYQPPWQDIDVLRHINQDCYIPLLSMIERHDNARFTLNIQGCLIKLLLENGMQDTVEKLKKLVENHKIEIVSTAMYHPILPLIPKSEIDHQIKLNEDLLIQVFGNYWKKDGFFPPEMAVSFEICNSVKKRGYKWIIMSGIANTDEWPTNFLEEQENGLITLFRDDYLSNEIAFKKIEVGDFVKHLQMANQDKKEDSYIITAMDGETFGYHIPNYETSFLGKSLSLIEDIPDIQVEFLSELQGLFPVRKGSPIRASTWSTDWSDISSNVPYPLWSHPFNQVHKSQIKMLQALYKLMEITDEYYTTNDKNEEFYKYYRTARWFYDQALHSCWLWWASQRPHWSPNLIYKGLDLVMKTALNAQLALLNIQIGEGDEYYATIINYMEKLMITIIDQELAFRKIRTI